MKDWRERRIAAAAVLVRKKWSSWTARCGGCRRPSRRSSWRRTRSGTGSSHCTPRSRSYCQRVTGNNTWGKKVRNRILPPQQLHSRQGTLTHIPTNHLPSFAIRTHRHTCYRWTDRPSVLVCTACKRTKRRSRDNNRPKGFSLVTTYSSWSDVKISGHMW